MIRIKNYILAVMVLASVGFSSCSDFLNTIPKDELSPDTFWKDKTDVTKALVGCYDGWWTDWYVYYGDAMTDNAHSFHRWDGYQAIADGSMSPTDPGDVFYQYDNITRCNEFLANVDFAELEDSFKSRVVAEVRFIRAFRYYIMTMYYGEVPLVTEPFDDIESAKVDKSSNAELVEFVLTELAAAAADLPVTTEEPGNVSKGAALAIKMRFELYLGKYAESLVTANQIEALNEYDLYPDYEGLFFEANENNVEVILDIQAVPDTYSNWLVGTMLPNGDGGWSAVAPLQSLVDEYETVNGLTIDEDATYEASNPYKDRDPRLRSTILTPGQTWIEQDGDQRVFNSVEEGSIDYFTTANNSSISGYNMKKYMSPVNQFGDVWNTGLNTIVCRYAEVLLTIAECKIETNAIDDEMYSALDDIRSRAGMPLVDRVKYNNQESLRELVRRERRVELAMEGFRRFDIIRWDIASDVMNGDVYGAREGSCDESLDTPEDERLNLTGDHFKVETRTYSDKNRYLPIPQTVYDANPNLTPNPEY